MSVLSKDSWEGAALEMVDESLDVGQARSGHREEELLHINYQEGDRHAGDSFRYKGAQ